MKRILGASFALSLFATTALAQTWPPVPIGPSGTGGGGGGSGGSYTTAANGGPVINVQMAPYNATGNGATDDTAAIQTAAAAAAAAGGTLYFPCASTSYLVSSSIFVQSNTKVAGAGFCAKIQTISTGWAEAGSLYGVFQLTNVSNIEITGVHMYGTTAAALGMTPKLINLTTVSNIDIHDNWFENQGYEGIDDCCSPGGSQNVTYINIHDNYFNSIGVNSGLPAIQMNFFHSVAEGNIIVNSGTGIGASGQYLSVVGNHIVNPTNTGIGTGDGSNPAGLQVIGNSIEYNPTNQTVTGIGIYGGFTITGQDPADQILIEGNHIKASAAPGNTFSSNCILGSTASYATITGNVCELTGSGTAIQLLGVLYGSASVQSATYTSVTGILSMTFATAPFGASVGTAMNGMYANVAGMTTSAGSATSVTGQFLITSITGSGTVVNVQAPAGAGTVTINSSTGTMVAGGANYTVSDNTVQFLGEAATSYGLYANPNGSGKQINIVSSGNKVYGLTSNYSSGAFWLSSAGGGTITGIQTGDFASGGQALYLGANYAYTRNNISFNMPPVSHLAANVTFTTGSNPTFSATNASNIASITRNGAGSYTVAFTTALPSPIYQVSLTPITSGAFSVTAEVEGTPTTTGFNFETFNVSGTATDFTNLQMSVVNIF